MADCYIARRKIASSFDIYKNGDEVIALTGGYASYAELAFASHVEANVNYAALTKLSTSMRVSWNGTAVGWRNGVVRIGNMIDLSGINTIKVYSPRCNLARVNAGGYESVNLFVRDNNNTYVDASTDMKSNSSNVDPVTGSGVYTLDVSTKNGLHYIGIYTNLNHAYSFSYFDISQIELIR